MLVPVLILQLLLSHLAFKKDEVYLTTYTGLIFRMQNVFFFSKANASKHGGVCKLRQVFGAVFGDTVLRASIACCAIFMS